MNINLCPRTRLLFERISTTNIFTPETKNEGTDVSSIYTLLKDWMRHKLNTTNAKKGTAILPYRWVYGKGIRLENWSTLFADKKTQYVIQLPAGTLGIKNDQPIAFVYDYAKSQGEVLFVDATQAPRASEHTNVLSESGMEMLKVALEKRKNTGTIFVAEHDFSGSQPPYLNSLPSFSKLVPRPSNVDRTDASYKEELARLTEDIEKLRKNLGRLLE